MANITIIITTVESFNLETTQPKIEPNTIQHRTVTIEIIVIRFLVI